ncbi:LLM class flavin-dependent oxidoreductase [Rhodovarius crocodyli]|nr:LLM class flavin-dependent oxidoreductase [Rhodovarius crocodyli]
MSERILPLSERVSFGNQNRFKLGFFGANMSCGTALTTVPERWEAGWEDNLAVAKLADEGGIDFLLPVARWKGYGGRTDPAGVSHETIAWAIGLLAQTKRINIFATVHAPFIHPVFAAKQFATADHIGAGRFGLNIVVGWNDDEFEMFDVKMPAEERYPYAREWIEVIRQLWSRTDEFDFEGKYLQLRGLRGRPKPVGGSQPMVLNAGMSDVGQAFAIECCDGLFSNPPRGDTSRFPAIVADAKARAQQGRDVAYPVFTSGTVVCRRTMREAEEFYAYCEANADWDAIDTMLDIRRRSGRPLPPGDQAQQRVGMLKGHGDYRLVGDPDYIAGRLAQLAEIGVDGIAMLMVNQAIDAPLFIQEVVPRLERLGLRVPAHAAQHA